MKILLEGCDCSGKSSIAAQLSDLLELPLRERIVRVGPNKAITAHMNDIAGAPEILDRSYFISDYVYEPLVTGKDSVFASCRSRMEFHTMKNCLVVYVKCSSKTILERYRVRGDEDQTIETILLARERYEKFFKTTKMPFITINTDGMEALTAAEKICQIIGGNFNE